MRRRSRVIVAVRITACVVYRTDGALCARLGAKCTDRYQHRMKLKVVGVTWWMGQERPGWSWTSNESFACVGRKVDSGGLCANPCVTMHALH